MYQKPFKHSQESGAGGMVKVQGQSELYSKSLPQRGGGESLQKVHASRQQVKVSGGVFVGMCEALDSISNTPIKQTATTKKPQTNKPKQINKKSKHTETPHIL